MSLPCRLAWWNHAFRSAQFLWDGWDSRPNAGKGRPGAVPFLHRLAASTISPTSGTSRRMHACMHACIQGSHECRDDVWWCLLCNQADRVRLRTALRPEAGKGSVRGKRKRLRSLGANPYPLVRFSAAARQGKAGLSCLSAIITNALLCIGGTNASIPAFFDARVPVFVPLAVRVLDSTSHVFSPIGWRPSKRIFRHLSATVLRDSPAPTLAPCR